MAKLKEVSGDLVTLKVKSVGEPKDGDYGESKMCEVESGGKTYVQFVKPKGYPLFIVGKTLIGARQKKGTAMEYFDFYEAPKGTGVLEQTDLPPSAQSKPVNLIGRGASYNLAFQYCLVALPGLTHNNQFDDFMQAVNKIAILIAPDQEKFVNNL